MNFPQRTRFHSHECNTKHARNREDRRIYDLDRTSLGDMCICLLGEMVCVGLGDRDDTGRADNILFRDRNRSGCAWEYEEVGGGDIVPKDTHYLA